MKSKFTFLALLLIFIHEISAQVCQDPIYICSNSLTESFTLYNDRIAVPMITDGNTCVKGAYGDPICGGANFNNQTWIIAKVLNPTNDSLFLKFNTSNGEKITISIFGTYSGISSNMCNYIGALPNFCKFRETNSGIYIPNIFENCIFYICVLNESNLPGIVELWSDDAQLQFFHFNPNNNSNCTRPTAKITTDNILVRKEEAYIWTPSVSFTGQAPFYYKLLNGNYEFSASDNSDVMPQQIYSLESFDIRLGTVRNSCGSGTVDSRVLNYLVYDKDTSLVSCFPFDGNFDDYRSGLKMLRQSGTFGLDRENNSNAALELNGVSDYLKYPARDLKGENYVISLWVKPQTNTGSTQCIFGIGTDPIRQNQLWFKDSGNGNYIFQFDYYGRSGRYDVARIPATPDTWVHLIIQKTPNDIIIKDNFGHSNGTSVNSSDVPFIGNNAYLWIGSNATNSNFFKGSIDQFKYFSGGLPSNILDSLSLNKTCDLILCNTRPVVTLPGFVRITPGTNTIYTEIKINSKLNDKYRIQSGDGIPGYHSNAYTNTFNFYVYKKENNLNFPMHISNGCGTAILKDTMVFVEEPFLEFCLDFNGNATDFFGHNTPNVNLGPFTQDRNNNEGKALKLNENSKIFMDQIHLNHLSKDNYAVTFWFKPDTNLTIGQDYIVYEYFSGSFDKVLIRKNSSRSYSLIVKKFSEGNSKTIELGSINNRWTHFAIIFQAGNTYLVGNLRVFINSEEKLNINVTGNDATSYNQGFNIGAYYSYQGKTVKGSIDNFKIFSGGLTRAQVLNLYTYNNECNDLICDKILNLDFAISKKEYFYGEPIYFTTKLINNGNYRYNLFFNQFDKGWMEAGLRIKNYNINEIFQQHTGENYFIAKKIQNPCGVSNDAVKLDFIIKPRLLNCLNFDENSWAIDFQNNIKEIQNIGNTTDRFGSTNKAIEISQDSKLAFKFPTNSFKDNSFSFWLNFPQNAADSFQVLFAGNATNNYQLKIKKTNNQFYLRAERNSNTLEAGNYKTGTSQLPVNPQMWHHIVAVFEAKGLKLYINGQNTLNVIEPDNYQKNINVLSLDTLNINIGSDLSFNKKMTGYFDDFKIFEGGLNEYEVNYLHQSYACNYNYCPESLTIKSPVDFQDKFFGGKFIRINNTINANTILNSNHTVLFEPGVFINSGTTVTAEIKNCQY
ncbi:MAG: LamG domain-containing protein [Spirosomataceae bacterium]